MTDLCRNQRQITIIIRGKLLSFKCWIQTQIIMNPTSQHSTTWWEQKLVSKATGSGLNFPLYTAEIALLSTYKQKCTPTGLNSAHYSLHTNKSAHTQGWTQHEKIKTHRHRAELSALPFTYKQKRAELSTYKQKCISIGLNSAHYHLRTNKSA